MLIAYLTVCNPLVHNDEIPRRVDLSRVEINNDFDASVEWRGARTALWKKNCVELQLMQYGAFPN